MASWRDIALATGEALEAVAVIAARDGMAALALAAHLGSCAGIAIGLSGRLSTGAAAGRLAFAMALFLPILGALGWIAAALVRPGSDDRPGPAVVRTPIPGPEAARIQASRLRPPPGASSASTRVVAARGRDDPGAIALLRRSLTDPDEDVRLVAHAVLESRHRIADRALHEAACELARAPAERRRPIHRRMAAAYWELARTGLAEGDCLVHALERARHHVQTALSEHPEHASLLLLARIELGRGNGEEAEAALVGAVELGLSPVVAAPYLAEAAFLARRFDRVRHRLAIAPSGNAAVGRLRRYWS